MFECVWQSGCMWMIKCVWQSSCRCVIECVWQSGCKWMIECVWQSGCRWMIECIWQSGCRWMVECVWQSGCMWMIEGIWQSGCRRMVECVWLIKSKESIAAGSFPVSVVHRGDLCDRWINGWRHYRGERQCFGRKRSAVHWRHNGQCDGVGKCLHRFRHLHIQRHWPGCQNSQWERSLQKHNKRVFGLGRWVLILVSQRGTVVVCSVCTTACLSDLVSFRCFSRFLSVSLSVCFSVCLSFLLAFMLTVLFIVCTGPPNLDSDLSHE